MRGKLVERSTTFVGLTDRKGEPQMAIVGYRRTSTTDQRLDRQDLGPVDKCFDDQVSGKGTDRPALRDCLAYVREGDTLRVHSTDRLARSLRDLLHLLDNLTGQGVRVEFIKE